MMQSSGSNDDVKVWNNVAMTPQVGAYLCKTLHYWGVEIEQDVRAKKHPECFQVRLWVRKVIRSFIDLSHRYPAHTDPVTRDQVKCADRLVTAGQGADYPVGVQYVGHYGLPAGLEPSSRARYRLESKVAVSRSTSFRPLRLERPAPHLDRTISRYRRLLRRS